MLKDLIAEGVELLEKSSDNKKLRRTTEIAAQRKLDAERIGWQRPSRRAGEDNLGRTQMYSRSYTRSDDKRPIEVEKNWSKGSPFKEPKLFTKGNKSKDAIAVARHGDHPIKKRHLAARIGQLKRKVFGK